MKPVSLFLCILLNTVSFAGNEGGHGGDTVINRILLARLFALQIVARADSSELSTDQKTKMQEILSRDAVFSKPGEHVVANDDSGHPVEVSASYDEKTDTITFNVGLCQTQVLSELDAIMLYLHEAGHAVGLSKNMAARRQDFTSDIGYRLVEAELQRPDTIFSSNSILGQLLSPSASVTTSPPSDTASERPWVDVVTNELGAHASTLFQNSLPNAVRFEFRVIAVEPSQQKCLQVTEQTIANGDGISMLHILNVTNTDDRSAKVTLQSRALTGTPDLPGAHTYVALGISPSTMMASGSLLAFATKKGAEDAALNNCRQGLINIGLAANDCEIAVEGDACASLARGDHGFGTSASSNPRESAAQALKSCSEKTSNCITLYNFCTPGSPGL